MAGQRPPINNGERERLESPTRRAARAPLLIEHANGEGLPPVPGLSHYGRSQIAGRRPLETLVYVSNMARQRVAVGTTHRQTWMIERGRIGNMVRFGEHR